MFEYIRFTAQLPYSEKELNEKNMKEFWGIFERAKERVKSMQDAGKKGKK